MRQFRRLVIIQFLEYFREPGILFWAMAFPVVMAWGLGIAFTGGNDTERDIAWVSGEGQALQNMVLAKGGEEDSREVRIGDADVGTVTYHFIEVDSAEASIMILRGHVSLILDDRKQEPQFVFDPKSNEARLDYMMMKGLVDGRDDDEATRAAVRILSDKGMRYIDFLVAGLLAMNIMFGCMWGVSYSLIDKRNKKLLRRMVAAPMNRSSFLFSSLVSRFSLNVVEAGLLLGFSWIYFGFTVQGSWLAMATLLLAGNFAFFGIAVLMSSKTSNTQVGNGLINAVTMPMLICSGVFFSYHNFPDGLVEVIKFLPLTILADNLRSVCNEGAGLADVWQAVAVLGGLGTICFAAGRAMYKWY